MSNQDDNLENASDIVTVIARGNFPVDVPKHIADNEEALKQYVAAERVRRNTPLPDLPTISRARPSLIDRGMEAVTGVNRPLAELLDVATAPVQYPIAAIRQGTLSPEGGGFFRSRVPERGAFAGDDSTTRVIAAAGELATLSVPSGVFTRAVSNLARQASTLSPTAFQRVMQELGKTTAQQDVGFGLLSGAGGELAVESLGENDIIRLAGQVLAPAAWSATAARLLNYTKNNFLKDANPSIDELKGLKTTFFGMIDDSGARIDSPDIKPFIAKVDNIINQYTLDGAGNATTFNILNNLKTTAAEGELTFTRLLNDIKKLKTINYETTEGKIAYNVAKELDQDVFNWNPIFPEKLKGQTVQEVVATARELTRREGNARILSDMLRSADLSVKKGEPIVKTLKNKIQNLIDPQNKAWTGNWSQREENLLESAMEGQGLSKLLNFVSGAGFNSNDLIRSLIYGAVFGGGAILSGGGNTALTLGILSGTAFAKATSSLAASVMKRDVKLMQSIVNAGEDYQKVFSAYIKNTPQENRDPRELASLFVKQKVLLPQASELGREGQNQFLKDSTALAIGIQIVLAEDKPEQQASTQ